MKNKIFSLVKGMAANLLYQGSPNPNIWLFSSVDNLKFNYNSKYLFLYVREHLPQIMPRFVINDVALRKKLSAEYGEAYFVETKTLSGIKKAMEAKVWFVSAGLPVYCPGLFRRYHIINLWHGVPLKKIALMEEGVSAFTKKYFKLIFSQNYRYVLATSESLVPIMEQSFQVNRDKIRIWGQPRNDFLFHAADSEALIRRIYGSCPAADRMILYAPTYRDTEATRLFPFADFEMDALSRFLEENRLLLFVRMHLEEKNKMEFPLERVKYLNADRVADITEYLNLFDLLVTDYSSIYIDFLLLNRPILFLPYDKDRYLRQRGLNFEYDSVTPGDKPDTMDTFLKALLNNLDRDPHQSQRERVNKLFNQAKYPCCRTICDEVMDMEGLK